MAAVRARCSGPCIRTDSLSLGSHARNEPANRTWPIVTCHSNFWNCFTILRHPFRSIRGLIGHLPLFSSRISFPSPPSRTSLFSYIDYFARYSSSRWANELQLLLLLSKRVIVRGNLSGQSFRRHCVNLPCFLSSRVPLSYTIHRFLQASPPRFQGGCWSDRWTSALSTRRSEEELFASVQDFKFRRDNRPTFRLSKEDVGDSRDSLTAGH